MKHAFKPAQTICACALAGTLALAGCASGAPSSLTEEQQANRSYMSKINETMVELDTELDSFNDAVSRGDVVNMRTQAENAYKALDALSNAEAPEALASVHKSYTEGAEKLRTALDQYIALYAEASNSSGKFDWSKYDDRIKEIQALYDEGVAALEAGDKAAAEA